jgi:hypothetical protein
VITLIISFVACGLLLVPNLPYFISDIIGSEILDKLTSYCGFFAVIACVMAASTSVLIGCEIIRCCCFEPNDYQLILRTRGKLKNGIHSE